MSSQEPGAFTTIRAITAYFAAGVFFTIVLILIGFELPSLLVFAIPYLTIGCVLIARFRGKLSGQALPEGRGEGENAALQRVEADPLGGGHS